LRETNSVGNDPSRKRCQVAGRAKISHFPHSHTVSPSQGEAPAEPPSDWILGGRSAEYSGGARLEPRPPKGVCRGAWGGASRPVARVRVRVRECGRARRV